MSILGLALGAVGITGIGAALVLIPGAMAAATRVATAVVSFIVGLPWAKIWWIIPLAAAVIFGFIERHGKHAAEAKIPALEQRAANSHTAFMLEKKAFATEKASLDRANGLIDANNRRIDAAHAALEHARVEAAADEARNAKLAQSTDARIAAIRASANDPHRAPCTLPGEAKRALDGL